MLRTVCAWAVIGGTSLLLGSCGTLLLPRFDGGALNPDIRFLNAGDVMNGVKCAMTAFMLEREDDLLQERRNAAIRRKFSDIDSRHFLLLYGAEYKSTYRDIVSKIGSAKTRAQNQFGIDNEFNPYALGLNDKQLSAQIYAMDTDPNAKTDLEAATRTGRKYLAEANLLGALCWPDETGPHQGQLRHFDQCNRKCVLNVADESDPSEPAGNPSQHWDGGCKRNMSKIKTEVSCPQQLGATLWNYSNEKGNGIKSHCVPLPDYSRFSLDPTQQAAIDLTLLASNQGTVFYDFIDRSGLGPLKEIIAAGNRTAGIQFPKVDLTTKGTTTFLMSVQMPQTIFQSPSVVCDPRHPQFCEPPRPGSAAAFSDVAKIATAPEALREALTSPGFAEPSAPIAQRSPVTHPSGNGITEYSYRDRSDEEKEREKRRKKAEAPAKTPAHNDYLTRREFNLVKKEFLPREQFRRGCGDNGVMPIDDTRGVDYLALKKMLHNIVEQQNDDVTFRGNPDVALDQLALTSAFQISLDVSASTYNIFRFFPLINPPSMGVKPDHTHTLKITLRGAKKRGDAGNRARLFTSCAQRLQNTPKSLEFCNSPKGLLLESIAQSVEQKGAGSNSP